MKAPSKEADHLIHERRKKRMLSFRPLSDSSTTGTMVQPVTPQKCSGVKA